jgi:phosphoribosylcarboxyaminoimidazole (NCAIR) mutase
MLRPDDVARPNSAEAGARAGARRARRREAGMSEPSTGDRSREPQDPQDPSAREGLPAGAPGISLVPELMEEAEVQAQLDDIDVDAPRVGIVMGSKSDMEKMEQAARELEERGILHEVRVIIAGAGISAALPGAVAAHTDLPVIGVPLSGRLSAAGGLDAILSIVQMPPGVPVACVGLDNARNAAILAARILGA